MTGVNTPVPMLRLRIDRAQIRLSVRRRLIASRIRAFCSSTPLSLRRLARRAEVRCSPANTFSAPAWARFCRGPSGTPSIPVVPADAARLPAITSARRTSSGAPARRGMRLTARANMATRKAAGGSTVFRKRPPSAWPPACRCKDAKQMLYNEVMGNFNSFLDDRNG